MLLNNLINTLANLDTPQFVAVMAVFAFLISGAAISAYGDE